jgi:adenosylhomocysteine nucleosidase
MIRFVVALQAEARPLLSLFRMEPVGDGPFRVFRGEDPEGGCEAWLIVSGLGKAAAAAATVYLHLVSGGLQDRSWLNVGVGGSAQGAVGDGFVAHKITDPASGVSWYPQLVIDSPRPTAALLTVERMEEEYRAPWIYEMDGAGFFPIACRFASAELVHCFRVISDTPDTTLSRRMSGSSVQGLIEGNLEGIADLARVLAGLAREIEELSADPTGYAEILERWDFTAVQQRRLRRLLQRLTVLAPGDPSGGPCLDAQGEARDVLRVLAEHLEAIPVRLPEPKEAAAV